MHSWWIGPFVIIFIIMFSVVLSFVIKPIWSDIKIATHFFKNKIMISWYVSPIYVQKLYISLDLNWVFYKQLTVFHCSICFLYHHLSLLQGGFSQPRDWTQSPTLQVDSLPAEPQRKPKNIGVCRLSLLQGIFPTQETKHGPCIAGGFFTNWAMREAQPICKIRSNINRFFWFSFIWGCLYFLSFLKDISVMLSS